MPEVRPTNACVGVVVLAVLALPSIMALLDGGAKEQQSGEPKSPGVFNSPACACFCKLNTLIVSSYPPESSMPGSGTGCCEDDDVLDSTLSLR